MDRTQAQVARLRVIIGVLEQQRNAALTAELQEKVDNKFLRDQVEAQIVLLTQANEKIAKLESEAAARVKADEEPALPLKNGYEEEKGCPAA